MTVPTLYPGIVNSPATFLTSSINDSVTTIPVNELSYFPSGENLATIGDDDKENPETIKYTGKSGTSGAGNLTGVTRGFQGIAQSWDNATRIRRNFTEYDYDALCDYITNHSHISGEGTLIPEGGLSLSDVTTGNTSTSKHGLCPKLSNDATEYLNGVGTWTDAPHRASITRQAIINGNFDVWQRGTTVTDPSTNTFLADRWKIQQSSDGGTLPTIIHSRQATTPGDINGSFYFYRINVNGAGSSLGDGAYHILNQWIEHGVRYLCGSGKKVTLSFKARSSIANKNIGATIIQVYGTGGSPSSSETITGKKFALTSSWQNFELTVDTVTLSGKTFGTNNDDYLVARFFVMWGTTYAPSIGETTAESFVGSGNIDIAQVQLCAGDIALPFEPKSYAEELRACQRYYQNIGIGGVRIGIGLAFNTTTGRWLYTPNVELRVAPTMGTTGTASDYELLYKGPAQVNCTAVPTLVSASTNTIFGSFTVSGGLTAGDAIVFATKSAGYLDFDAEL